MEKNENSESVESIKISNQDMKLDQESIIQENDQVIIYENAGNIKPVKMVQNQTYQCKYGVYPHSEMIGKPYGQRVLTPQQKFITPLQAHPDLWTRALTHQTQILYQADISQIIQQLNLTPGRNVVEAGSGSGSLTVQMSQAIYPGRVYTFEFNLQRMENLVKLFNENLKISNITIQHRNVVEDGFGEIQDEINSLFLDIPNPWSAVGHVKKILFRGNNTSRFCCFSPGIEQVQKTVEQMKIHGFTNIRTFETLNRGFVMKKTISKADEDKGHTGYLTFSDI